MEPLSYSVYSLFTIHTLLLSVKLWALYTIFNLLIFVEAPTTKNYMLVFKPFEVIIVLLSLLVAMFEIYFFINFFVDTELYFYEYVSVADQAFFTVLVVLYIKQEGRTHG